MRDRTRNTRRGVTRQGQRRRQRAVAAVAIAGYLLVAGSFLGQQPSREYVRLGGRVIAIENTAQITLALGAGSASTQSVAAGTSASFSLVATPTAGIGNGTLQVATESSSPTGMNCTAPGSMMQGQPVAFALSCGTSGLTPGTFVVTVSVVVNSVKSNSISLTVIIGAAPDFGLQSSSTYVSVQQGSEALFDITVNRTAGFTGTVTFAASPEYSGISCSASALTGTQTAAQLRCQTAFTAPVGTYPISVTGSSGGVNKPLATPLTMQIVSGPTFSLTGPASASVRVVKGDTTSFAITVASAGWTGNVVFSVIAAPPLSCLRPADVALSAGGQVTTAVACTVPWSAVAERTYDISLTGSSSGVTSTILLGIVAEDPYISVEPKTVNAPRTASSGTVVVRSNIPWTASTTSPWLNFTPSGGAAAATPLNYTVAANLSGPRQGTIAFTGTMPWTSTLETLNVVQVPSRALQPLSPNMRSLYRGESGQFNAYFDDLPNVPQNSMVTWTIVEEGVGQQPWVNNGLVTLPTDRCPARMWVTATPIDGGSLPQQAMVTCNPFNAQGQVKLTFPGVPTGTGRSIAPEFTTNVNPGGAQFVDFRAAVQKDSDLMPLETNSCQQHMYYSSDVMFLLADNGTDVSAGRMNVCTSLGATSCYTPSYFAGASNTQCSLDPTGKHWMFKQGDGGTGTHQYWAYSLSFLQPYWGNTLNIWAWAANSSPTIAGHWTVEPARAPDIGLDAAALTIAAEANGNATHVVSGWVLDNLTYRETAIANVSILVNDLVVNPAAVLQPRTDICQTSQQGWPGCPNVGFSQTLNLTTGTHRITVVARDGTGQQTTAERTVTVQAAQPPPSFELTAPVTTSATVAQGKNASFVFTLAAMNGFSGTITTTAQAAIPAAGLQCSATPNQVALGATQLSAGIVVGCVTTSATPATQHQITVTSTGSPLTKTATLTLTVTAAPSPSFTIQTGAVAPASIGQPGTATANVTVNSVNGFAAPVTLTGTSSPTGLTCEPRTVTPPVNGSATVSMQCSSAAGTAPNTYSLSVQATSAGSGTQTAALSPAVAVTDTIAPSVAITAPAMGQAVSGMVSISATSSDNVGVAGLRFEIDGVQAGAEIINPASTSTYSWNTAGLSGYHVLTAVARDALNSTRSASVVVSVGQSAGGQPPYWYNAGWGYRKRLTVDRTRVAGPLTNFPMLVAVTDASLRSTGNGGNVGTVTGNDFVFTGADGVTKLSHEIESYDAVAGKVTAWVNVPSLTNTADTVLYLYFGNAGSADQSAKNAVWDSGYKGVWHLGGGGASDSTSSGNHCTVNNLTAAAGQIGGGLSSDGLLNRTVDCGNAASLAPGTAFTDELWFQANASESWPNYDGALFSKEIAPGHMVWVTNWDASKKAYRIYVNGSMSAITAVGSGAWHHFALSYDGTTYKLYVDGVSQLTYTAGAPGANTAPYLIGAYSATRPLYGLLDEARHSNVARTAAWIGTQYNNQSAAGTFVAAGATEAAATAGPVAAPAFSPNGGTYSSAQTVAISTTTAGASIRYTVNGSAPTSTSGTLYTGPIAVSSTATVQAIAYRSGWTDSPVSSAAYTIGGGAGWYNAGWGYRKRLTVDRTRVAGPLTNFPMLVAVTDASLRSTGNGGNVGTVTGYDFVVTGADGVTKLSHEIESYDAVAGKVTAWVNVPSLTNTADTVLYLYFGNGGSADQSAKNAVWDSGYKGVWHLGGGGASDSTSSGNHCTVNNLTASTGQIGGGLSSDGLLSRTVDCGNAASLAPGTAFTDELWFQANASESWPNYDGALFSKEIAPGHMVWVTNWDASMKGYRIYVNGSMSAITAVGSGAWHHFALTYDGTTYRLYVDGVSQLTYTAGAPGANTAPYLIGAYSSSRPVYGLLDEARHSNVARTAAWIGTQYNNQSAAGTFVAAGATEAR